MMDVIKISPNYNIATWISRLQVVFGFVFLFVLPLFGDSYVQRGHAECKLENTSVKLNFRISDNKQMNLCVMFMTHIRCVHSSLMSLFIALFNQHKRYCAGRNNTRDPFY